MQETEKKPQRISQYTKSQQAGKATEYEEKFKKIRYFCPWGYKIPAIFVAFFYVSGLAGDEAPPKRRGESPEVKSEGKATEKQIWRQKTSQKSY